MNVRHLYWFVVCLLMLASWAVRAADAASQHKAELLPNKVVKAELVHIDYFEAEIELTVFIGNNMTTANLGMTIPGITDSYTPYIIQPGENTLRIYVSREKNLDMQITSEKVNVFSYTDAKLRIINETVELIINWPGPDTVMTTTSGSNIKHTDFSSISKCYVNRGMKADEIIRNLLVEGMPVFKIRKFGFPGQIVDHAEKPEGYSIAIGSSVKSTAAASIISAALNADNSIDKAKIMTDESSHSTQVYIGSFASSVNDIALTSTDIEKLKQPSISQDELYRILRHTSPDKNKQVEADYQTAYRLIDSGSPENIATAKVLLDKIILENPDYAPAYIEQARYQMKKEGTSQESLQRTEKILDLAINIDPKIADAYVLRGYVYTNQDRYEDAESQYKQAESLGTSNLWLHANRGLNYEKMNKKSEALTNYLKVIKAPINEERNKRPKSWVYRYSKLFEILTETGQYQLADDLYYQYENDLINLGLYSRKDRCLYQDQAHLRLYYLQQPDKAIESYMKAKQNECHRETPVLPIAHYVKAHLMQARDANAASIARRQAESHALSDSTLFYMAAISDFSSQIIPDLKSSGRNIDHCDEKLMTATSYAVSAENHDAISLLHKNGADINHTCGEENISPLLVAVKSQSIDMVKLLLKLHANPNQKFEGKSMAEIADANGSPDIARMLRSASVQNL